MKAFLITCIAFMAVTTVNAQLKSTPDSTKKLLAVEASCGSCNFGMKGKGCSLAIRTEGKSYFVDGTTIDDHGDPHESDGFCEAIRKAEVQGELVADRFKVTYFRLLPVRKAEPVKQ
jgi:hypothetical protein